MNKDISEVIADLKEESKLFWQDDTIGYIKRMFKVIEELQQQNEILKIQDKESEDIKKYLNQIIERERSGTTLILVFAISSFISFGITIFITFF